MQIFYYYILCLCSVLIVTFHYIKDQEIDMKLVALFLLLGAVSSNSILSNIDLDEYWKEFRRAYEKSYSSSEEHDRREIWEENVEGIIQHNFEADMGKHTYHQGINEYSDMDYREFLSKMTDLRSCVSKTNASLWIPPSNVTIPERVDWRDEELVTPEQDQEESLTACQCGENAECPCGTGDCPCGSRACPCGTGACACGSRAECQWGSSAACPGRSPAGRSLLSLCPCGSLPVCPCGQAHCQCGTAGACPCGSLPVCPCGTPQCQCGTAGACPCGSLPVCPCGTSECRCGRASACTCGSLPACPWGKQDCRRRKRRSLAARNQLWTEKYQFVENGVESNCPGFVGIPSGDEEALKQAVATVGPISAVIDSTVPGFGSYKYGVYDEPTCGTDVPNHSVLIVGYGTLDGIEYWLVKNSWGETWGMKGYIMMSRNKNNQCGIATKASYPLV